MNEVKIISIFIGAIVLSVSAASMVGAVDLTGEIDVEVDGWLGVVTPIIGIDNQNLTLDAELVNDTYTIDCNMTINLDIVDNSGRDTFYFSRGVVYSVIIFRKGAKLFPLLGFVNRLVPHIELFKSAHVVDSQFGGGNQKQNCINISLNYDLPNNETYTNGEELTMNILVMGIFPGDVNGIADDLPIIDHKTVTLTITYV